MGKWETVRLGDVAEIGAGQGAPQGNQHYSINGIPFIKAGHLAQLLSGYDEYELPKIELNVAKSHDLKLFTKDTILFAKSGMSCLKGYVYQLQNDCYIVNHLACVKPKDSYAISAFLKYFFIFSPPNRLIKSDSYPSISLGDISNIKLPLPPLRVQQQIADALDRASVLTHKRKAQIDKLDLLIKSRFLEMFGDPVTNPKGWEIRTIRDLVSEVRYGTSKPAVENGRYVYLRMNNITYEGSMDYSELKYIDIDDNDIEKYVARKGDMLFNRTNSKELVGKTAVFKEDKPMIIAGYIIRVRTNKLANSEYISGFLNSRYGKQTLLNMCKSIVGQANINAKELQSIKIPLVPIDLQNQFADFVHQVEAQKSHLQQSLAKLELNYNSLMQKCFRGEIF